MQLKVTSATNREQSLSKVGAALYVITREDIASSGANGILTRKRVDFRDLRVAHS